MYVRGISWGWNLSHTENKIHDYLRQKNHLQNSFDMVDHKVSAFLSNDIFSRKLFKLLFPESNTDNSDIFNDLLLTINKLV